MLISQNVSRSVVQDLAYINPMRYFLVIVRGVFLEGDGISMLWDQYWPLALIALASMARQLAVPVPHAITVNQHY